MDKYIVIVEFQDKENNMKTYKVGEVFPSGNQKVSAKRLKSLASKNNNAKIAVIEKVKEVEEAQFREIEEEVKEETKADKEEE